MLFPVNVLFMPNLRVFELDFFAARFCELFGNMFGKPFEACDRFMVVLQAGSAAEP